MSAEPTAEPSSEGCPEHLGGHHGYTNMDRPTLDYLVARFKVRSMLDVGCGTGAMVDYARTLGLKASGIDGDPAMARDGIRIHDYTTGPLAARPVDLVWCVEFVEHVAAEHELAFMETFRAGRVLFLTHAQPGQGGHHHVNLQSDAYWLERLMAEWKPDYEATGWVRVHSEVVPYIKENALVFVRRP